VSAAPALLADIGGTNARFALSGPDGVSAGKVLACADFPSLQAVAEAYLAGLPETVRPRSGAFAVASPITGDEIHMTNLPWAFSIAGVRAALGLERLEVINDFTAVALAIPALQPEDRVQIGDGTPVPGAPIGIIGPGSGLGVSALVPGPAGWLALATEGGHVTMAPISDRESAVLGILRKQVDHVSAERVVSGPGLMALYRALEQLEGHGGLGVKVPADVTEAALSGRDPVALEALEMFCAMLGTLAGNLALTLGARGGVYIAGGIVPRLLDFLVQSRFRKRFGEKGRMRDYLADVPTYVVTHPLPAMLGLRARLAQAG
jgi:glucokinase